jgi:hypothetical protein
MADYLDKIFEYRLKGYCCAQILLQMGLDEVERENQDLINAANGLCNGLHSGLVCGALSGGACLLSFFEPEKAPAQMIPDLIDWFKERFNSCDCSEIIGDDPINRVKKCPDIVVETYEKVKELLEEYT